MTEQMQDAVAKAAETIAQAAAASRPKVPVESTEVTAAVQTKLRALGYANTGPATGEGGEKTQAAILDFKNRNELPLSPKIDGQLLEALQTAPPKAIPLEQASATAAEIAPKVESVAAATAAVNRSWWTKFTTWFFGVPSAIILFVGQFDAAIPIISSVRSLFSEISWKVWLTGFIGLCAVFAVQAHMTSKSAQRAEDAAVDGYKKGTVGNDNKEAVAP